MDMLEKLVAALLSVTENVGHYEALKETDQYIVWAEDGQSDCIYANDIMREQVISGTIDYFTTFENDKNIKAIQEALQIAEIAYKLNSIQYEKDTLLIHYEWAWEVV